MQMFVVDKASHKATYGIADNGADPPVPSSYANADMNVLLKNTMDAVAAAAYQSLVRRLWCRWFILNKLLSQKKQKKKAAPNYV